MSPSCRNKWAAPVVAHCCSIPIAVCAFVSSLAFTCGHRWQVEKQHVHEEMMEQDLACFHLLKQTTSNNKLIHGAGCCLSYFAKCCSLIFSVMLFKIIHCIRFAWCLKNLLIFSKLLARMPLSEFPGLAATVRNRDRMTTRKGQTSHAFRKPSRRNRSPPCWTCGSWLMCFACKSESETVKTTTQYMEDRCGKHMNTLISRS